MRFQGFKLQVSQWFRGLKSHCGHMHCAQRPAVADSHPSTHRREEADYQRDTAKYNFPLRLHFKWGARDYARAELSILLWHQIISYVHTSAEKALISLWCTISPLSCKAAGHFIYSHFKLVKCSFFFLHDWYKILHAWFQKNHPRKGCCSTTVTSDGWLWQINGSKHTLHTTSACRWANLQYCTEAVVAWIIW